MSTEHLLNASRRYQTSKMAIQYPQNEVGQKTKIKKETDKGCQDRDLCPGKGIVKEEKFAHTLKHPHKWGQGVGLWNLRGENRSLKIKMERIHHRDHCQASCMPTAASEG